jgi:uncharacterized membrane protein YvbJ
MFCAKCGARNDEDASYCKSCAQNLLSQTEMQSANIAYGNSTTARGPSPYGAASIVFGAIAFLFFPIVFGPIGIIMAAVSKSKNEPLAIIAFTVSVLGLVVGFFLGAMFY